MSSSDRLPFTFFSWLEPIDRSTSGRASFVGVGGFPVTETSDPCVWVVPGDVVVVASEFSSELTSITWVSGKLGAGGGSCFPGRVGGSLSSSGSGVGDIGCWDGVRAWSDGWGGVG